MRLVFGPDGLMPAIVQDRQTGEVRMLAYMNRDSLSRTLETGRATFFSRSRGELWEKGATSGNTLHTISITTDCDADALLLLTDPIGPTCHTGSVSCFFRPVQGADSAEDDTSRALPVLSELEREVLARKSSTAKQSYTRALLDAGPDAIGAKINEEAGELAQAIAGESNERVANEAADLIYHMLVGLASRGVSLRDVATVLASRRGVSGHIEKAART